MMKGRSHGLPLAGAIPAKRISTGSGPHRMANSASPMAALRLSQRRLTTPTSAKPSSSGKIWKTARAPRLLDGNSQNQVFM